LRPDSSVEPIHIGNDFWQRMMSGKLGDFHDEYLVTTFAYDKDWPNWEMHPNGDELVVCTEGTVTLFQLEGALLYVDEEDNVVGFDDVLNHTRTYHDFCRSQSIEPLDLDY